MRLHVGRLITRYLDAANRGQVFIALLLLFASISCIASTASASWRQYTIDGSLDGADGVRAYDADGDGDLDIASAWEESARTRLYLNPGGDAVHRGWPYVDFGPVPGVEDALVADVDGDGRMDIISSGSGTTGWYSRPPSLFIHFAPDTGDYMDSSRWISMPFPPHIGTKARWMFSAVADINQDGHTDIVVGSRYWGRGEAAIVGWIEAPASHQRDLNRWRFHTISDAGWIMSLLAHDMDGDGDPDIVISDRKIGIHGDLRGARWLENPAIAAKQEQRWQNHWIGGRGLEVMFIALADLDRDGDSDVVVPAANPSSLAWFERLDGSGKRWRRYEIAFPVGLGRPKAVAVSDIDCDGRPDLVISTEEADPPRSGVVWFEQKDGNAKHGVWHQQTIAAPDESLHRRWVLRLFGWIHDLAGSGLKFDRIETIDLDRDGAPDVVTTEENQGLRSRGLGVVWFQNPVDSCRQR